MLESFCFEHYWSSTTGKAISALVCGELAKNKPDFQHQGMKYPSAQPSTLCEIFFFLKRVNIPAVLCSKSKIVELAAFMKNVCQKCKGNRG